MRIFRKQEELGDGRNAVDALPTPGQIARQEAA
jgi:hypothetical protein